ncbi:hypothetical protein EMIHUDRAFT_467300 [Emiliania huxleyi CCMP1516]|uniref:Uncharacterized protein n=2 Tax=Emiliania huxleyi TaxID=2903 RepID=A0A0D3KJH9_EMIH1|nr:hypothetical protein EMIHUDRAFT_467300 [Emiliania huxleyi CCMP1516]EOD35914.1 hypothetical protein EMIHUDRAFT_467300 [Emiliania huxleyi CCMP1516]|eukprot:XP_005788343.1 hypothetical protein EMIHUDRAFT_467300 [Emiliania huxleyi CCMP1516]
MSSGASARLACHDYRLTCVAGAQPARATLSLDGAATAATTGLARVLARRRRPSQASADGDCHGAPLLLGAAAPGGPCRAGDSFVAPQCTAADLLPPPPEPPPQASAAGAAPVDVLLATCDNAGHGLFALLERVVNQVLLARRLRMEVYVFVGPVVLAGPGCPLLSQPYFDRRHGDNVWEYFFRQPGAYRRGDRSVGGRPVRSLQVVSPESLYSPAQSAGGFTQAYGPRSRRRLPISPHISPYLPISPHISRPEAYDASPSFDPRARGERRRAAASVLANGSLVRPKLLKHAWRLFAPWRRASSHVLGLRDPQGGQQCRGANGASSQPEAAYLRRVVARYGEWEGGGGELPSRPACAGGRAAGGGVCGGRALFQQGGGMGHAQAACVTCLRLVQKSGSDALLDSLLLSHCDYLLHAASALSEAAIWFAPRLHDASLNLQYTDRLRSQRLPPWAAAVGADDAAPFCDALARGCEVDAAARSARGQPLLRRGQCAACDAWVGRRARRTARASRRVAAGSCAGAGLRPLTEAECVAYARAGGLTHLGSSSEPSEPRGCALWRGATTEFNRAPAGGGAPAPGCETLRGAEGECVCAPPTGS